MREINITIRETDDGKPLVIMAAYNSGESKPLRKRWTIKTPPWWTLDRHGFIVVTETLRDRVNDLMRQEFLF